MDVLGGRKHVEEWVNGVFDDHNKTAVSQCLNDIDNMSAWDGSGVTGIITNIYTNDCRVYHVSAGKKNTDKTCTLFFIKDPLIENTANIIGVYQHTGNSSYEKVYNLDSYPLDNTIVL